MVTDLERSEDNSFSLSRCTFLDPESEEGVCKKCHRVTCCGKLDVEITHSRLPKLAVSSFMVREGLGGTCGGLGTSYDPSTTLLRKVNF